MSVEQAACPNRACADYSKRGGKNIVPVGRIRTSGGQPSRCTTCGRRFTSTQGTFMYRLKISQDTFLDSVMLHYGGYSSRRIARAAGISKNTALRILERAAEYADQVKLALVRTGKAPQDVADRLAELIRWRSAARVAKGRSAKRGAGTGGLRGVAGAWSGEDHGAILGHIYRLRERQGVGG